MPPYFCQRMSLLTSLKLVSTVDAVFSILLISLAVTGILATFLGYSSGQALQALFGCLLLGVLSTAQLWAAVQLYKVAKGNNSENSGIWSWIVVNGIIITIFLLSAIEGLREMNMGISIFFFVITVYKIHAIFVVIKFKNRNTETQGLQRGDVYSLSNAKSGQVMMQIT